VSVATPPGGAEHADIQAAFAATLVDEWVRGGVTHAVVCPGSRSTPLAVALAAHPDVAVHVRLDERSAAFVALGLGLADGRPAVLVTTSGTAAAELHAAVVEADLAGVAMVVCTADRPPELRDVGAPQTIDQHRLFGGAVRWFADPGLADHGNRATWRSLAARSVAEATAGPNGPGPVHLNLPFREPLLGDPVSGGVPSGRTEGRPWHQVEVGTVSAPPAVVARIVAARQADVPGLIVAGAGCGDPVAVLATSRALGWPILADPRSGLRSLVGETVAAADGILRSAAFTAAHRPAFVLQLGAPWVSKVVTTYLASLASQGAEMVAADPWWQWVDPDRSVSVTARTDPGALCKAVVDATEGGASEAGRAWRQAWLTAELSAQGAIERALHSLDGWTEPALARRLVAGLSADTNLVVSSSMPIRDVEAFGAPRPGFARVLANRGANGIDGVVSTAQGVALAGPGPTVALVGDLAFLHDVSALVRSVGPEVPCTVVVADNGGGGIFSFLPPASVLDPTWFETLFGTPQRADVAAVAAGFELSVEELGPDDGEEALVAAVRRGSASGRLSVVRVRLPDRQENVAVHGRLNQAVVEAVEGRR
jgi:2-succinyl-5-enolpyruvyl-6-hydroxy-3-cyclohexene-1-carboxylate synthase